jgi:hypothetical protein
MGKSSMVKQLKTLKSLITTLSNKIGFLSRVDNPLFISTTSSNNKETEIEEIEFLFEELNALVADLNDEWPDWIAKLKQP